MKKINKIIRELRESKNIGQLKLAELLNISPSMMGMIEQGRRNVNDETKVQLCRIFDVSMDYLMGLTSIPKPKEYLENQLAKLNMTEKEYDSIIQEIIKNKNISLPTKNPITTRQKISNILFSVYSKYIEANLYFDEKDDVIIDNEHIDLMKEQFTILDNAFLNLLESLDKSKILSEENSAIVFVYGTIPAGIPMEMIEDIIDTEEISSDMLKDGKQYFGLKIKGDSMYPEYQDGDIIICEKADDCESGDDCVVMVNGYDGTFKKVIKDIEKQTIRLQPINTTLDENGIPLYEAKTYSKEEIEQLPIRIIGIEIELRRKNKKKRY